MDQAEGAVKPEDEGGDVEFKRLALTLTLSLVVLVAILFAATCQGA